MVEPNATEAIVPSIATEEKVTAPTEDAEAKIAALEVEKAKILEERDNYKNAYLKESKKPKTEDFDENEEDRMEQVAKKVLSESRLAEIAREQDAIIQKALKENKELKLAQMNKTTVPGAMGTHSESVMVTDTLITPDQMKSLQAKGWSDKDIERYKKNLQKNSR